MATNFVDSQITYTYRVIEMQTTTTQHKQQQYKHN